MRGVSVVGSIWTRACGPRASRRRVTALPAATRAARSSSWARAWVDAGWRASKNGVAGVGDAAGVAAVAGAATAPGVPTAVAVSAPRARTVAPPSAARRDRTTVMQPPGQRQDARTLAEDRPVHKVTGPVRTGIAEAAPDRPARGYGPEAPSRNVDRTR